MLEVVDEVEEFCTEEVEGVDGGGGGVVGFEAYPNGGFDGCSILLKDDYDYKKT